MVRLALAKLLLVRRSDAHPLYCLSFQGQDRHILSTQYKQSENFVSKVGYSLDEGLQGLALDSEMTYDCQQLEVSLVIR